jgi:hypothetical protein
MLTHDSFRRGLVPQLQERGSASTGKGQRGPKYLQLVRFSKKKETELASGLSSRVGQWVIYGVRTR